MDATLEEWFDREVLTHEAALTRFLARAWPNPAEVADLRHDTYVRVLEAAAKSRPLAPKSFVFTTARHLLTDRARRRRIVSIELLEDLDTLNVLVDEISAERQVSARQQLMHLSNAFNLLPDKCREVVWLRKVENLAQKAIAQRLGIREATVEKHVSRGMRMLADRLFGAEAADGRQKEGLRTEAESRHEQ